MTESQGTTAAQTVKCADQTAPAAAPRPGAGQRAGRLLAAVPPPGLILCGMALRQLGAAVAQPLFPVAGPFGVTTLRLVFSALVLLLAWRTSLRVGRRALPAVFACGTVLAGMNFAFYQALDRIPMGVTVAIELLGPLALAVAGSRRWSDAGWALLAAAGVALLTEVDGGLSWVGVAFALTAAGCWVGYILLGAKLSSRTNDGSGLALAMVWGALLALPVGFADAGATLLNPQVLVTGLGLALLSSVVPYSLEFRALRQIPPRVFGVLMSLEPAIAALIGLVVLSQRLGPSQWVALGCVVAASLGVVTRNR
ncbi:EamA family transporter [Streptomyces sp. 8N616]|uniref:EamA family transporter n=1 Tax=Streptomyces sp. 8N616 TaxID=3457414 RepID=UPI003FD5B4CB